jgi:UDP-N-acetylglucosamine--N-acetylmuramyl-(pentapeptide) pyrophosphoryl-undecaprenol N-acetylglucosamine transferase
MGGKASIMLAAGGTAGHLFPALALSEALGRRGVDIDLMSDERADKYGVGFPARSVHIVPSATASPSNPLKAAAAAITLSRGIASAARTLGEIGPQVVIGFGGYPTFPPLMAAKLRGIPTIIHEQNAVLGRANKMLAKRVDRIATSFLVTKYLDGPLLEKVRHTGNPVRSIVLDAARYAYVPPAADGPIGLLVFGGSQGARFLSNTVPPALASLPVHLRSRLQVVQQARPEDVPAVEAAYRYSGIASQVAPFFTDLPSRMAWAHLVIGRAGASTITELTVIGRPSILVPLPHALDNDQLENATRLAESGGAWCIEERDLDVGRLTAALTEALMDPERLAATAQRARAEGRPDAVERLADLAMELVEAGR